MIAPMYDWLVVDLGDVAAEFQPEARLAALEQASTIQKDEIHSRLFSSGLDHDAELGMYDTESITAVILARLEHRLSPDLLIDAWSKAFRADQELLDCLRQFSIQRALFTNNGPMLDACLSGPLTHIASAFDKVICSWHLGTRKPDPASFARTALRLGCEPSRLLLVDDSPANTQIASITGWQTITHHTTAETLRDLNSVLRHH
jgi:glucose-1-phosphatase